MIFEPYYEQQKRKQAYKIKGGASSSDTDLSPKFNVFSCIIFNFSF